MLGHKYGVARILARAERSEENAADRIDREELGHVPRKPGHGPRGRGTPRHRERFEGAWLILLELLAIYMAWRVW